MLQVKHIKLSLGTGNNGQYQDICTK